MTETTFNDLKEFELLADLQSLESQLSAWRRQLEQVTEQLAQAEHEWGQAEERYARAQQELVPVLLASRDDPERQNGIFVDTVWRQNFPEGSKAADRLAGADAERNRCSGVMTNLARARQDLAAGLPSLQQALDAKRDELARYRSEREARLSKLQHSGVFDE